MKWLAVEPTGRGTGLAGRLLLAQALEAAVAAALGVSV